MFTNLEIYFSNKILCSSCLREKQIKRIPCINYVIGSIFDSPVTFTPVHTTQTLHQLNNGIVKVIVIVKSLLLMENC